MAETLEAQVAVVGAGPAGIAAACRAAEAGRQVLLMDESAAPGGQIWRGGTAAGARPWLERLTRSGAKLLPGTVVVDAGPERALLAERDGRPLRIQAERVVLATGARERFLPFPGWTLPNVLGVGGAQALLKSGASFAGRRVIVAGSGPLLLPVAASLAEGGAKLALVAEQAPFARVSAFALGLWRQPAKLVQAALYRSAFLRAPYRTGVWVRSGSGAGKVAAAVLTDGRREWRERCDVLCCAYGLVPNLELPRLMGCAVRDGVVVVDERQETSVPGVFCAGEPTGVGGVELALVEGELAGLLAAGGTAPPRALCRRRARGRSLVGTLAAAFALREELRSLPDAGTVVCRCEDVPLSRLKPGWQARRAKLYTRAGMGPCQGRVCGAALEFLFGWPSDTVRAPLKPVRLGTLEDQA